MYVNCLTTLILQGEPSQARWGGTEGYTDRGYGRDFMEGSKMQETMRLPTVNIQFFACTLWAVNISWQQLWYCATTQVGDKKQAILAVAGSKAVVGPTPLLMFDGVTEKVTRILNHREMLTSIHQGALIPMRLGGWLETLHQKAYSVCKIGSIVFQKIKHFLSVHWREMCRLG